MCQCSISLSPESESSSESRSRSRTPGPEKITFITSFGGSDDEAAAAAQTATSHSGHAPSSLQHSAGHNRGSRSVTFPPLGYFLIIDMTKALVHREFWWSFVVGEVDDWKCLQGLNL